MPLCSLNFVLQFHPLGFSIGSLRNDNDIICTRLKALEGTLLKALEGNLLKSTR